VAPEAMTGHDDATLFVSKDVYLKPRESSRSMDYAILFSYIRCDLLTWKHYNLLAAHNPSVPLIPLNNGTDLSLPGAVDVSRIPSRWDISDPWQSADTMIYRWWQQRDISARRYVYCEYDLLAQVSFPEFLADCWEAPVACANYFTYEAHPKWCWFEADYQLLPEALRPHAAGIAPLGFLLFSHEALGDIVRHAEPARLFCEFRLGTTVNRLGIPVQQMARAQGTIVELQELVRPQAYPTIYHPIKDPSLNP
jgi:hypothetical protein